MVGKTRNKNEDVRMGFGDWGNYIEAKRAKLSEQYVEDLKTIQQLTEIFKNISIFVNGLTNPNADELKKLMLLHGGTYHNYQLSSTTHIIATNLPNVKIKQLGSVPIVKPNWIVDSVNSGKLLDYRRYLLYTNQNSTQPKLNFNPLKGITTKTASDPNFIEEFYNNSRLHLISTLSTELKQKIANLRDSKGPNYNFSGLDKLKNLTKKSNNFINEPIIMHIDMDCFFVSVSLRKYPNLKNQPVVVTHARNSNLTTVRDRSMEINYYLNNSAISDDRKLNVGNIDEKSSMSEIACCNYEARKFGIKNGMFLGSAIKLCPNLNTVPYNFNDYKQISHLLYDTIATYTLDIEAVSCDELYVDITNIIKNYCIDLMDFATHIRNEIMYLTDCPCSTGFGSNRLLARLATKKAKPCGQFSINNTNIDEFLSNLPLSQLPGIGYATINKLKKFGLINCNDINLVSLDLLKNEFGLKLGENIYNMAHGIDKKNLNYNYERKSISVEINYGIRFKTINECMNFFQNLCNELYKRLINVKMFAYTITLKLMIRSINAPIESAKYLGHGICDNLCKSITTKQPLNDSKKIFNEIKILYNKFNVDYRELRGIGVHLSKLEKFTNNTNINNNVKNKILENFLKSGNSNNNNNNNNNNNSNKINSINLIKPIKKLTNKITIKKNKNQLSVCEFYEKMNKTPIKYRDKIDLNILNELPDNIRKEIIDEYKLNLNNNNINNNIKKNTEKIYLNNSFKIDNSNFEKLNLIELRSMIFEWIIYSNDGPLNIDIQYFSNYLQLLVQKGNLELIKIIFNFMFRNFEKLPCSWHLAYANMVTFIQDIIQIKYDGGRLKQINNNFNCYCTNFINK